MSLHRRILIIVSLTIVSLIVILYAISRLILLKSFEGLEEQQTRHEVERARSFLSYEISGIARITQDWASWDQTYAFINGNYPQYIKVNLVDSAFLSLRLNLMMFVHSSGRVVFCRAFDLHDEKVIPFTESMQSFLLNKNLLTHNDKERAVSGIILLPRHPMLIASCPILTSEGRGPSRGTLIFGRYLDDNEVRRLTETFLLTLAVYRFDDLHMPHDFLAARSSLIKDPAASILVRPLSMYAVAGYTILKDIYGKPALILKTKMSRDVYRQGQNSLDFFILSILIIGMVFTSIIFFLLNKVVLSRLAHLSESVMAIRTSGNLSLRMPIKGTDELASLADEINQMLEAQEQAEKALQTYSLSDELTGIYNRRGFMTLAEQQIKLSDRMRSRLLLIFSDVDDLKMINDTLGHLEGDRALIDTAHLIKETFREADIVARIGGDEFVVLTMETKGINSGILITRLQERLAAFNVKGARRYKLSVSVGIACYDPENPMSIDELIAQADRLMYEYKHKQGGRLPFD
jgi:diguanylate cyclase (GGDEF)-like protein